MNFIRTQFLCSVALFSFVGLASSPVAADHGGTAALEQRNREMRKVVSGKILNESLPVFWAKDGGSAFFHLEDSPGKRAWRRIDLESGEITEMEKKPSDAVKGAQKPGTSKVEPALITRTNAKSPDNKFEVSIRDGKVFLNGEQIADRPGEKMVWENRVLWSPDSSRFVLWRNTQYPVRDVHYVKSSPETGLHPERFSQRYPKPGDKLNIPEPVIFFVDGRDNLEIDASLIEDPFQLRKFGWRSDSKRFLFEYIERGFGSLRVIEIDSESRQQRVLIDESDEKFVFVFGNTFRQDLKGGDEILWLSERDGWNHLYLIDGRTGKVLRQLTSGKWIAREVVDVDEKQRTVVIKMSGYHLGQDPYHIHYASVNLDDSKLIPLTEGDGTHSVSWSPDGRYFLDKWSRVDLPPVHEIRRSSDGGKIATLAESAGLENLSGTGWQLPQRFVAKDRNNQFDIHGVIFRPFKFDPAKRYPVVEAIYAGPHGAFTPKSWKIRHGAMSEMADAGFIVVKLDGLGTNYRGKAFHQVAYKNLIDSGFPDRRKWISEAAKKVPQMDLSRIGIYGGSAGGQSALAALLTHSDFYKAAAADCGCHDNRMDKIWWNEQWMDWPVGPHYEANSNRTHIGKLQGNLLLTVGELDKNVDPSSTLQIVDALIKADKDFEFILVPGAGHGVGEKPYLRRKRIEFFQRHLGAPVKARP